jgi:hypothetical protein
MTILVRVLLVLSAVVVVVGASLVAVAASAAPVPESGSNGLLTLDADPYPAQNMTIARGDRLLWPVTVDLDAPSAGELTVRVVATQPLAEDAAALRFELASCEETWVLPSTPAGAATCAGGVGDVVIPEAPFATTDSARTWSLGDIVPDVPRYFLVTLSLPLSTPGALADEPAEVSFGFEAADAALSSGGSGSGSRLAETGGMHLGPALLGLGLVTGGMALARLRRIGVPS